MLVNFYIVEFVDDTNVDTVSINLGSNIPVKTCAFFSANSIKYVFCVDANIVDVADVCHAFGSTCEFVHDLEVLEEQYNNTYYIGLTAPNQWNLCKIPEKINLPNSPFISRSTL